MNARDRMDAKVMAHLILEHDKNLTKEQVVVLAYQSLRANDEMGFNNLPTAFKYVLEHPEWKAD